MANLGRLTVRNTRDLAGPDLRICALMSAVAKVGKTTFAASLQELTLKYRGKPTLFIACEAADGGGTLSVSKLGLDYVQPRTYDEMDELVRALQTDQTYGGLILDNGTDYIARLVKPYALKFPSKERDAGTRQHGVPVRGDYQSMAEFARKHLNSLVNLTTKETDPKFRKDLIVTALEREKTDTEGNLVGIVPDFPGALSGAASALFQTVLSIKTRQKVIDNPAGGKLRIAERLLHVKGDGVRQTEDRSGIFKHEALLTDAQGAPVGILPHYEEWLKQFAEAAKQ